MDRQRGLVSAGGLVAGERPSHDSGGLFRVDYQYSLWHSEHQTGNDRPGADRHEGGTGASLRAWLSSEAEQLAQLDRSECRKGSRCLPCET